MALREDDWLPQAKRLAVGMRMRVHHRGERRANMTIANEGDRYWAHCQACKESGVLTKEHVLLAAHYVAEQRQMLVPSDLIPLEGTEYEIMVHRFLARKGMAGPYMPPLSFSPSTSRMFFQIDGQWHGRDITEKSNQKWLHFGAQFAGTASIWTLVTEDLFSMLKVQYALRAWPGNHIAVCSTLGANAGPAAVLALKNCDHILWMYDADKAGDSGYLQASKRMRPWGAKQQRIRPPEGLDPKDMDCSDIRALLTETLK